MLNYMDILYKINENMSEIKKYGVLKIGLFGSFAKNEQTEKSDIDILVQFEKTRETFENYMDLLIFLEALFSGKVDLVIYDNVRDELKSEIYGSVKYAEEL